MRLMIDGGGYAVAATAFADANQVAAMQYDAFTGKLAGFAAMAGDDSVAAEFAAAYDEAAAEAVAGFADLVTALATLGRLTEAALVNHDHAERASILPGAVVHDGESLASPDAGYLAVLPASPPSALGGDAATLSPTERWALDHLEGIFWPGADTARLRDAAHAWRSAAASLLTLTDYTGAANRGLATQVSPEIPLALAATDDVASGIRDLAAQYDAIAAACDAFADNVEQRHAEMLALLAEIGQMLVEGVLISAAVGLITAGTASAATAAATAARIAAQSPRFAAVLALFRSLSATTTAGLRLTREALAGRRLLLARYLDARVALRGERGAADFSQYFNRGFLRSHDDLGGHVVKHHVGKSRSFLAARFESRRPPSFASTFDDEASAEVFVRGTLEANRARIQTWMEGGGHKLRLRGEFGRRTGISMSPDGTITEVSAVRLILLRSDDAPTGWRLLTGFPEA